MHKTKNNESLKPGWRRVKFGDVVQLSKARCADPLAEGVERYVGLEHLEPGDLRIRNWGNVADGVTFTSVFQPGQVLFGKRRAYQRKVAVADFSGVCSGDIYVMETKDADILLPELLPFICQTDSFFNHAVGTSAGSLSPRTNWTSLAAFEFELPSLEEQKRVADLLNLIRISSLAYEHAVEMAEQVLSSFVAEEMSRARLHNPVSKFGKICIRVTDGTHQPPEFLGAGIPFLLVSNLSSGKMDWNIEKWISESDYQALTRSFRPRQGDVLLTLVGSYGVPVYVDWDTPFFFQRHIGVIRTDESKLNARYLTYFLKSPVGQWQCTRGAQGLAQKTITLTALKDFEIPLPPLDIQDKFLLEAQKFELALSALKERKLGITNLLRTSSAEIFGGSNV